MVYETVSIIGNRSHVYILRYNVRFRQFGIKYVGFYPKQRGTLNGMTINSKIVSEESIIIWQKVNWYIRTKFLLLSHWINVE